MTDKYIWPATIMVSMVFLVAGGLLALRVDSLAIIAVFAVVASTIGTIFGLLFFNGKIQKIEANTNGSSTQKDKMIENNLTQKDEMLKDLFEYVKNSMPVTKE